MTPEDRKQGVPLPHEPITPISLSTVGSTTTFDSKYCGVGDGTGSGGECENEHGIEDIPKKGDTFGSLDFQYLPEVDLDAQGVLAEIGLHELWKDDIDTETIVAHNKETAKINPCTSRENTEHSNDKTPTRSICAEISTNINTNGRVNTEDSSNRTPTKPISAEITNSKFDHRSSEQCNKDNNTPKVSRNMSEHPDIGINITHVETCDLERTQILGSDAPIVERAVEDLCIETCTKTNSGTKAIAMQNGCDNVVSKLQVKDLLNPKDNSTSIDDLEANEQQTTLALTEIQRSLQIVEREHTCSSSDDDDEKEGDNLQLRYSDITTGKELGRGGFGVVYSGSLYGSPVAIKMLHTNVQDNDEFLHEIDVMKRLRHPNIVLFVGATVSPDPLCIITELVSRGALMKIIEDKKETLGSREIFKFALDIARGMNYLHHSGIVHLDLTPNNILVTENNNCKVGDFGLSKVVSGKTHNEQTNGGTVVYTAPEVYKGERIRTRVDVYSFAVCLWQLYYRKMPYENMNQHAICFNVVAYNKRPEFDPNNMPPFADLIKSSWDGTARLRPTFDQLIHQLEALQRNLIKKPVRARSDIGTFTRTSFYNKVGSEKGRSGANGGAGGVGDKETSLLGDPNTWSVKDVVKWVENLDTNIKDVDEIMTINGITGKVLLSLTDEDMVALGLNKFGDRRGLQIELVRLVEQVNNKGYSLSAYLYTHHGAIAVPTVPQPKIPRVDLSRANVHINGHACIYIVPDVEDNARTLCSVCEDEFQDFERIHKCLSCNLLLHKECASVHECSSPSAPPEQKPEKSWPDITIDNQNIKPVQPLAPHAGKQLQSQAIATRSPFATRRQMTGNRRSSSYSKLRPSSKEKPPASSAFTFGNPSSAASAIVSTGGGMYTPSNGTSECSTTSGLNSTRARFRGLSDAANKCYQSTGGQMYTSFTGDVNDSLENEVQSTHARFTGHTGATQGSDRKEEKDWKRVTNVIAEKWNKIAKGDSLEKRRLREERILRVQENVEKMLGQVLLAKRESMIDYNNKRFEQSYLKFKASGEAIRRLADVSLASSVGKPFRNNNEPWASLNRFFTEPDRIPYREAGDEDDDYVVFVTMVRVKLEIALQESSMLLNPELSFQERSDAMRRALDFVLATEDILVDVDPPVTPEISSK
eukprot:CFRG5717T1